MPQTLSTRQIAEKLYVHMQENFSKRSEWEIEFIISMYNLVVRLEKKLTARQLEKLHEVYERIYKKEMQDE